MPQRSLLSLLILVLSLNLYAEENTVKDSTKSRIVTKKEVKTPDLPKNFQKADKHKLAFGFRLQKTMKLYWENGISIQYQPLFIWGGRPLLSFDFVSSRFGTAMHSNALQQETYRFGLGTRFRNDRFVQPGIRINAGYFHLDIEDEIFESIIHDSFVLSAEALLNFSKKDFNLQIGMGYQFLTEPGSLYPLYIALEGMWGFQW